MGVKIFREIINEMHKDGKFPRRVLMSALGVLVAGISVGMFKHSMLGVDPFQSLMSGLNAVIPISFGTLYMIANLVLLTFALVFDRHKIGLATLLNLFFFGYIAEFIRSCLAKVWAEPSLAGRLILLLAAVVIMCFASAFYFTADLGVSTYDAVSLIISERWGRISFKYIRIISDLICVLAGGCLCLIAGYSLGEITGIIGIGTIITAFFMGPLIVFFREKAAEPFLGA